METAIFDEIIISDLNIRTVIGVNDWERKVLQDVMINITLFVDIATASATDHINDTTDYKAITKRVIDYAEKSSFQLIESLIEEIAKLVLTEFNVEQIQIQIDKPNALRFSRSVGIKVLRKRSQYV
mgnify:CR=1 FL=1